MNTYRNKIVIQGLLQKTKKTAASIKGPLNIMEVCGTHTMTIHKYGLKQMLDEAGVSMLSGPGCPVCITPNALHEAAIDLVSTKPNLFLTTFGDMTRVPTGKDSLQTVIPADGSRVQIVYSPEESLDLARKNPEKDVVFFGVGFETTIPSIALSAKAAYEEGLENYSILSALWIIPPPLKALLETKDTNIQGFLYPGHVSAIIGLEPYEFIPRQYGLPGAVTGFEPVDILLGINNILEQIRSEKVVVANEYTRVVRADGNPLARKVMDDLLETEDAVWRGLGKIPASGLVLRSTYAAHDAKRKYHLQIQSESGDLPGCRCGDVLKGLLSPSECPMFGKQCKPDSPLGPCMVSFEGSCLAFYKYSSRSWR